MSLLSTIPLLADKKASRIRLAVKNWTCVGLGIQLETTTLLVVMNAPRELAKLPVGSSILIDHIDLLGSSIEFERARERLISLLKPDPRLNVDSLSSRASHHALLFILEARDPEVRRSRTEALRTSLSLGKGV